MNQTYTTEALDILRAGKVLLCPSDTIASLSCDATNTEAIERIFEIKQRPSEKRLIVLVSSITMLEAYVPHIPEAAYQLLDVLEEPTTIVYPKTRQLPDICLADDGSVGIRIVQDGFLKTLIDRFRKPIVSTSANISGSAAPLRVADADDVIKSSVDYVVDLPDYREKPSAIIKFHADGSFKIIRK